jgi:hypothetical protein
MRFLCCYTKVIPESDDYEKLLKQFRDYTLAILEKSNSALYFNKANYEEYKRMVEFIVTQYNRLNSEYRARNAQFKQEFKHINTEFIYGLEYLFKNGSIVIDPSLLITKPFRKMFSNPDTSDSTSDDTFAT